MGNEIKRYSSRINPMEISKADARALEVNGYSEEKWKEDNAVEYITAMDEIYALFINVPRSEEKLIPIGWNTWFDISFVNHHFSQLKQRLYHHPLDLMSFYWPIVFSEPGRPSLEKLYKIWTRGENMSGAHTAEGDAEACLKMYREGMQQWQGVLRELQK
jgi:DNA polymerase III epsilon subunit-like protein